MISSSSIFRKLLVSACLLIAATLIAVATVGVHRNILITLLATALAALGVAYFLSHSLTQRIRRLTSFADHLVEANSPDQTLPEGRDELGTLARSLNRTAIEWRDLVSKLSLESARREAILASMVEGVLAVDNELRITFSNESLARIFGIYGPIPERLPLLELARDPGLLEMLTGVIVSGRSIRQRAQFTGTEGRIFEVQAAPLTMHSHRGAIAILHDITDLERLERVRKDFVANVSHELRTPLTAIRGYAETLLEGALDDKENNQRFLEIIKSHAIRLENIASDLLALSELESGTGTPPEEISVRAALETALRTVEPQARLRGVKVTCGRLEDFNFTAERGRLEQALVNLLDNAVKFNRPGGEVHVEAGRGPEETFDIAVSDNGIGIPSEDLPRIFERFYRVDKARSREVGGTGLGLSIVKHVVERMGGTISVESQLGRGSTFTLQFPSRSRTSEK